MTHKSPASVEFSQALNKHAIIWTCVTTRNMLSAANRDGDCCMLAASWQTAGVLLADTGLIDSITQSN